MKKYYLMVLVLGLVLLGGCQTMSNGQKNLTSNLSVFEDKGEQRFVYELKNETKKVAKWSRSGQKYDYIIRDSKGDKVYQYSKGMFFTMAIEKEVLKPNDALKYEGSMPELKPGNYSIEIWLTANDGESHPATTKFKVN